MFPGDGGAPCSLALGRNSPSISDCSHQLRAETGWYGYLKKVLRVAAAPAVSWIKSALRRNHVTSMST